MELFEFHGNHRAMAGSDAKKCFYLNGYGNKVESAHDARKRNNCRLSDSHSIFHFRSDFCSKKHKNYSYGAMQTFQIIFEIFSFSAAFVAEKKCRFWIWVFSGVHVSRVGNIINKS